MDLSEIARELVVANRENRVDGFLDAHYAEDVVSAEPRPGANGLQVTETLEQLRQKHAWWSENMEVHSMTVDGPWLQHPDRFAVRFETDATNRSDASRSHVSEVAVYTVREGRIAREEFFAEETERERT